jgi:hypothetical protein
MRRHHFLHLMLAPGLLGLPAWAAVCTPRIEERHGSASLRADAGCLIDEAAYVQVVRAWLRERGADQPAIASLGLGRAVHLPWISRHISDSARQSTDWSTRVARRPQEHNRFVASLLMQPEFLRRLDAAFDGSRLTVTSASVEKVLVEAKVPFDAQVWLRLAPRS